MHHGYWHRKKTFCVEAYISTKSFVQTRRLFIKRFHADRRKPHLALSNAAINKWVKQFRIGNIFKRKQGSGRPRSFEMVDRAVNHLQTTPFPQLIRRNGAHVEHLIWLCTVAGGSEMTVNGMRCSFWHCINCISVCIFCAFFVYYTNYSQKTSYHCFRTPCIRTWCLTLILTFCSTDRASSLPTAVIFMSMTWSSIRSPATKKILRPFSPLCLRINLRRPSCLRGKMMIRTGSLRSVAKGTAPTWQWVTQWTYRCSGVWIISIFDNISISVKQVSALRHHSVCQNY